MRTIGLRIFRLGLLSGLLMSLLGCGGEPRDLEIVQLEPETAAQLADSLRETVAVQVADGLDLTLWAADPLVADPIALAIDHHGRAYITRTLRQDNSEFDIRGHQDWMIRSISLKTVEDRRAFLKETFATERSDENIWLADLNQDSLHDWRDLAVEKERVYRIEDTSGDGVADKSQLIIEDFHTEVTDVAGAVLARGEDVYLGVAPDLWRMRDTSGDGMIDEKESISHGYGVHIGFSGHGMSGLTMGPDGRVYWSIGDIGFHVVDQEGNTWAYPNQGGIFRSEPDGSGFEVFAAGVRNTHEFVFDKYGNLISVDNDGDHPGESERLVYLVDGSDSGWRANWQYGKYVDPDNNAYKVWMDEELFKPRFEGQAAYITPPVASYHSGPAGMAYEPGTALGDAWRDRFFVAEFTGSSARSRIFAFQLEPKGAGFDFAGEEEVTRGILATGLDFGPDGALYVADWLEGWGTKDRGRIWKLDVPGEADSEVRQETRALLAENLADWSDDDLAPLLRHADMRVRMEAQFALAEHGTADILLEAARQTEHQLARLHGLWGIGQLARQDVEAAEPLVAFLEAEDPEVRAQAAKVIGDVRYAAAAEALLPLLQDEAPRTRFFAAEALGRIEYQEAVQPIIDLLEANDDEDVYLRHAGALALARIGQADPVVALADHPSRGLRIAAVVALRRMQHPGVARFLEDEDEYIVTEAARAINDDLSIEEALPDLARVLNEERFTSEALLRRAINANLRLGTPEHAQNVAAFAARPGVPEAMRVEALATLGVWPKPSVLDRVDGRHRGEITRDPTVAREALAAIVEPMLTNGTPAIKVAAADAAGRLKLESAESFVFALLRRDPSAEVRRGALEALHTMEHPRMEEAVAIALEDGDPDVRMASLELIPTLDLPEERTAGLLASVLGQRPFEEQQSALEALGQLQNEEANEVLARQLDRLEAGTLAPEVQLDVIEAVEASGVPALQERLAQYRAALPGGEGAASPAMDVAAFRETLRGGNADRGRQLFYQHPAAQCVRCHVVGDWGGDVGPVLTEVGAQLTREQLLESLIDPSARIAPGFGSVALTLQDGDAVRGVLREETDEALSVQTADGEIHQVPKEAITSRQEAPSSMPPMGTVLNRRELRDLIEFLASLEG